MNNYVKEREVAASTLSRDQGVNMIHFPKAYTYEFKQDFCNFYNQGRFIQPEIRAAVEMSRES